VSDIPNCSEAARRVLTVALKLEAGDKIVVFADETAVATAEAFLVAAGELGLRAHLRYVSIDEQTRYLSAWQDALSHTDIELLNGSRAILTCLTDNAECSHFRQVLIDQSVADDRKVGHMPGINERILGEALNVDYERAADLCDDLALILALGRTAELTTFARGGSEKSVEGTLRLDLGGIERPSIVSSGVIPSGTWGNLPGGETFIAPLENRTSGTFVLTGSFDGYVLPPNEFIQLEFDNGCLVSFDGIGEAKRQFAKQLRSWEETDHLNYSNLAELGIGINEQIRTLTGRALLDEKCSETVHIAIGANHGYGGTIQSNVHQDLVTWQPCLSVDGQSILTKGTHSYDRSYWRENIDKVDPDGDLDEETLISRSATIRCEHSNDDKLRVRRAVSR
jgi:leucyl aminopeptidase (aminopeptidase T)